MPRKAPSNITAWSFSRWNTYEQCPRKAKYQIIDRMPIEQNDAMRRGSIIHILAEMYVKNNLSSLPRRLATDRQLGGKVPKEFEHYLTGDFDPDELPEELRLFDDEFFELQELMNDGVLTIQSEEQWAFNRNWTPCDWFGKAAWLRTVVDLMVYNEKEQRVTIIDYKTGKIRDGYDEQLKLYVASAFAKFPQAEEVRTELWYLDQGEIKGGDDDDGTDAGLCTQEDGDKFTKYWTDKVKPMLVDQRFAPKPSHLCRWCDFSHAKGGPCEY